MAGIPWLPMGSPAPTKVALPLIKAKKNPEDEVEAERKDSM